MDWFFGIVFVILDFLKFFLLEPFDISACVFINLFDIILNEFLFVFLDDIVFNSIMAIETNSSVGDIRTTTSHSIDLNL